MKTKEAFYAGIELLKQAGIANSFLDSEIIVAYVKGLSRTKFFIDNYELTKAEEEKIFALFRLRAAYMPMAYITNQKEFMSLPFYVDRHVLIPRPDTEVLAETAISLIKKENMRIVMDIGCGSGCIPISVSYYTGVFAVGVDISRQAVAIAKKNALQNKTAHKTTFIQSNLFDKISDTITIDALTANPPYIRKEEIKTLTPDIQNYEPYTALCGGSDGLYFYKKIAAQGKKFLRNRGVILFEIGSMQKEEVCKILKDENYQDIDVIKDLARQDRVVLGRV